MKIPYKPKSFTKRTKPVRYIIIHDLNCQFSDANDFFSDSQRFQISKLRTRNFVLTGETDLNYHFVVEKINDDYETVVGRPLNALCDYPDIKAPYSDAIHIAVLGNFDIDVPPDRLYKQLAYRAVSPLIATYRLNINKVLLHHQVSDDESSKQCPGQNFDYNKFLASLKVMLIPR